MMKIVTIEKLTDDLFAIVIGNGSETYLSACRLRMVDVAGGSVIRKMEFESDDFQRLIMMGDINIKEIAKAIDQVC